ncbi:MAG: hypothetical protein IJD92_03535 [Bacilli bacterium]|nr:hypothetical protein [Bacilli bacterium]
MELINNEYIKVSKSDLYIEQIKAESEKDNKRLNYCFNLLKTLSEYESKNKTYINYVYVNRNSEHVQEFYKNINFTLSRESILNALTFATLEKDYDMSSKLGDLLLKKWYYNAPEELLNYIMNHNMDINEYLDGEKEKFIYNDTLNIIEKGYIFKNNNNLNKTYKKN